MAIGFKMGEVGSGAPGPEVKRQYLYRGGEWFVGYDNPGSYTRTGSTVSGATLDTNKITITAASGSNAVLIGTSSIVNVANYNTLHILAKGLTSNSEACGYISLSSSKNVDSWAGAITTVGSVVEYAVDVTNLSEIYISLFSVNSRAMEIYAIWLGDGYTSEGIDSLIPTMTSNTTPSGICSASSIYNSDYPAWKAFDGTTGTWNSVTGETHSFVAYAFPYSVVAKSISYFDVANASSNGTVGIKFQASNDGSNWIDLTSEITLVCTSAKQSGAVSLADNTTSYTNYRMYLSNGSNGLCCRGVQVYGYDPTWQPVKFPVIYDNGSWGVPYANPGSYRCSGRTPLGATLNPTNITVTSTSSTPALIGTANKIDVTNYSMLKVLARAVTSTTAVYVNTGLDVFNPNPIAEVLVPAGAAETEYVVDLTNVTGEVYVSLYANDYPGRTIIVSKIWLE